MAVSVPQVSQRDNLSDVVATTVFNVEEELLPGAAARVEANVRRMLRESGITDRRFVIFCISRAVEGEIEFARLQPARCEPALG